MEMICPSGKGKFNGDFRRRGQLFPACGHYVWTEAIIVVSDDPVKSDSVGVLMVEEPVDTQAKEGSEAFS